MPFAVSQFKVCSNPKCGLAGVPQPVGNFSKGEKNKDGLQYHCKKCQRSQNRLRSQESEVWNRKQSWRLLNRYGITLEQKRFLWAKQRGLCKCCGDELPFKKSCTDHIHGTMIVRGIICKPCNTAIGYLRDSPERCYKAAAYLEPFAPPYIPPKAA
jgi:hypothetical protein